MPAPDAIAAAASAAQSGNFAQAAQILGEFLADQPDNPDAHYQLGNILIREKNFEPAIAEFRRAVSLRPDFAAAWRNLGALLLQSNQTDAAIDALRRAVDLSPADHQTADRLCQALFAARRWDESIDLARQLVVAAPENLAAHLNLATALSSAHQIDEALAALAAVPPQFAADPHTNFTLGSVHIAAGNWVDAIAAFERVISADPSNANAHSWLGFALLASGELPRGFREFAWTESTGPQRQFSAPVWDGSDPRDKRILIHAKGGFGDTFQFARYIPLLADRGARIILEVPPQQTRIMQRLRGVDRLITLGDPHLPYGYHCPLFYIPMTVGTTRETIPQNIPYLDADPALIQKWQQRLRALPPSNARLTVGLAWAGSPHSWHDYRRSMTPDNLAPLAAVPNIRFISLQKRPPSLGPSRDAPPPDLHLIDWTADLTDFAETAALIANLDLVISVDTAVIHLAAAMAKPAWNILSFPNDWRWPTVWPRSPWYPTMKLFRQPKAGDWQTPIAEVVEALKIS